jgi:SAM-dependent methyltransferase
MNGAKDRGARVDEGAVRHRHDARKALRNLDVRLHHAVLDLGCGDGHHTQFIESGSSGRVISLDLNWVGLRGISREFQPMGRRHFFVCGDALRLPFKAGVFDRVIYSLLLYLLPVPLGLAELHRVMRLEGKAYIRVPMLSVRRAWKAVTLPGGFRMKAYRFAHVTGGMLYSLLGRQVRNRFLSHDGWACYVPRGRFVCEVRHAGFQIDCMEVDYGVPGLSSIDAWISRS